VVTLPYVGEVSPYWLGVIGSVAVEVAAAAKECSELNGRCPERYKQPFYLIVRGLLALASGTIPAVAEAPNALTSFYLGASAPLFLDRLARGVKPSEAIPPPPGEDV
jgi:hypothetical protein